MKKMMIFMALMVMLTGCQTKEEPKNTQTPVTEPTDKEEVNLSKVMEEYTKENGCDNDVAFRLSVLEEYVSSTDLTPEEFLKKLENGEELMDKDGNPIVVGLVGPHESKVDDSGVCRFVEEKE